MNIVRKPMTVEEFIPWAMAQPRGRFELVRGEIVAMAPERARHALAKLSVAIALREAIKAANLPCTVFPDGMTVRIDTHTAYEPDASVQCGSKVDPDQVVLDAPLIVVEVLSPSTGSVDRSAKLVDYFTLPSVQHYLIVDPERQVVTHHARDGAGHIATRIVREGVLSLDPPGLTASIAALLDTST